MLCRFSFPKIAVLAARLPGVQKQLFRLLSRDIGRVALLAGDWPADQRMAAFLIGLSRRLSERGFSPSRFQLTMARTDIANYLRLAPATVSRVLRRLEDDGLLRIERRDVEVLDMPALGALAAPVSVSYTHLDVYKRQGRGRATPPIRPRRSSTPASARRPCNARSATATATRSRGGCRCTCTCRSASARASTAAATG